MAIRLPIYNFVNDLDVLPYLLDPAMVKPLLEAMQPLLPSSLQHILEQTAHVAGRFIAVGNTYLLLGNHIKILTKNWLDQDVANLHLFKQTAALINTAADQDLVMMRVMHDHLLSNYSTKLQDAVMCCVPILFIGGNLDSYEAVRIKRMSVGDAASLMPHLAVLEN